MKKFEADCLESVYELATKEFTCSITDLEIEIIQQPSKGFLGFGKKSAIIQVCYKDDCKVYKENLKSKTFEKKDIHIEDVSQ
jgi:spoIIIJ-associated protein